MLERLLLVMFSLAMIIFVFHHNSEPISILILEQCKWLLSDFAGSLFLLMFLLCSNPTLGLNAQVGDGPIAPSFGVGGQLDTQTGELQPTLGTGLK